MVVIAEQKRRGIVMERPGGMPDQVLTQRLQGTIRVRSLQQARPVTVRRTARRLARRALGYPKAVFLNQPALVPE
ncbi:hypothetical protein [Streptomyces sp. NPDC007205]|uniref:hypothetical protein n=1 Tax=Streptomyces sp. NPDC007205 TaxID=3154316 RepID=UPI0033FBB13A